MEVRERKVTGHSGRQVVLRSRQLSRPHFFRLGAEGTAISALQAGPAGPNLSLGCSFLKGFSHFWYLQVQLRIV